MKRMLTLSCLSNFLIGQLLMSPAMVRNESIGKWSQANNMSLRVNPQRCALFLKRESGHCERAFFANEAILFAISETASPRAVRSDRQILSSIALYNKAISV
jgi:hypothetical protein